MMSRISLAQSQSGLEFNEETVYISCDSSLRVSWILVVATVMQRVAMSLHSKKVAG